MKRDNERQNNLDQYRNGTRRRRRETVVENDWRMEFFMMMFKTDST